MYTWSWPSFLSGLLLGIIITVVIVWILYALRLFVFGSCPTSTPKCRYVDYFNDPGDALAAGQKLEDILYINTNGVLIYKRPPKDKCIPGDDQEIIINNPQYCKFDDKIGKNISFNSPIYYIDKYNNIENNNNCIPILQWDPNNFKKN